MLRIVCTLLVVSLVQGNFLSSLLQSHKCYDLLGCFSNGDPFTNSWDELPSSPQDNGVTLTLLTRASPLVGEALDWTNASSLSRTHFDWNAEVKVIIHGYRNNGSDAWILNLTSALLQADSFNVIKVAWGPGAHAFYPKAAANSRVIGAVLAHFLTSLKDALHVSMSRVHLMGHSLGAHVAGYTGARVRGISRISGMDPAGPLFEDVPAEVRIDPTDADFVDCIHSDGVPITQLGLGTMKSWCDADFYPNGGGQQPGCPQPLSGSLADLFDLDIKGAEDDVSCSHSRSHDYFIDSISRCKFPATPCDTYQHFKDGKCTCPGGHCPSMGYHTADQSLVSGQYPKGTFFLQTTSSDPFC